MKSFLSAILLAVSASAYKINNRDSVQLAPFNGKCYTLFYGCNAAEEAVAREQCKCLGGDLLNINGVAEFEHISCQLKEKACDVPFAFMNSWNGDDYRETCIAFYQGGAIAVPLHGCCETSAFVCEFKKVEKKVVKKSRKNRRN